MNIIQIFFVNFFFLIVFFIDSISASTSHSVATNIATPNEKANDEPQLDETVEEDAPPIFQNEQQHETHQSSTLSVQPAAQNVSPHQESNEHAHAGSQFELMVESGVQIFEKSMEQETGDDTHTQSILSSIEQLQIHQDFSPNAKSNEHVHVEPEIQQSNQQAAHAIPQLEQTVGDGAHIFENSMEQETEEPILSLIGQFQNHQDSSNAKSNEQHHESELHGMNEENLRLNRQSTVQPAIQNSSQNQEPSEHVPESQQSNQQAKNGPIIFKMKGRRPSVDVVPMPSIVEENEQQE